MSRAIQIGDRFELGQVLGRGGFGVVYEAFDKQLRRTVALKTLTHATPAQTYRLKQEFRSVADLAHPNLVTLHELFYEAHECYFTMELVDGCSFVDFVRGSASLRSEASTADLEATPHRAPTAASQAVSGAPIPPERIPILRQAFRQFAEGLNALHSAGHVHRDIKPSNVLVTRESRVVILDFGLAAELETDLRTMELAGTPAYMSPEHVGERPLTPASDWYSAGIMLYECLTGRRPFPGTLAEVVARGPGHNAEPPASTAPWIPADLNGLVCSLLAYHPLDRPEAAAILRVFSRDAEAPPPSDQKRQGELLGRADEEDTLRQWWADSRLRRPALVAVHGAAGVGKTALIAHFLQELRDRESEAWVIEGRCHERENVPYKALDKIVDRLCQRLNHLPVPQTEALLPRHPSTVARLFPAFETVLERAAVQKQEIPDAEPHEIRRRGFAAIRELLGRIAERRPLVLFIDNAQCGDLDSAFLLAEIFRAPDPPVVFLILCFLAEPESAEPPFLRPMSQLREAGMWPAAWHTISLGNLQPPDAHRLAARLIGESASNQELVQIARESGGNPLFVQVLARHRNTAADAASADLSEVLRTQVEALDAAARILLQTVALAGRPIELAVAQRAAGTGATDSVISVLRANRWLRWHSTGPSPEVDVYHDRLREAAVSVLSPEDRTERHAALAVALESGGAGNPELLYLHFQQAGNKDRATLYAVAAAEQASQALAFERAASLYRSALELGALPAERVQELRIRYAEALTQAGRGREAADAWFAAAGGASGLDNLDLSRRGAEQLLRSGYFSEGTSALQPVLKAFGIKSPSTRAGALWLLARTRLSLALSGTRIREQSLAETAGRENAAINACFAAALSMAEHPAGLALHSRHLLMAVRAGEPKALARALGLESVFRSALGVPGSERIRESAIALGLKHDGQHGVALAHIAAAMAAWNSGDWHISRNESERALLILRAHCPDAVWESTLAYATFLRSLFYMGEINELCERVPELVEHAHSRGDLFGANVVMVTGGYVYYLAADHPAQARQQIEEHLRRWEGHGFRSTPHTARLGLVETALYESDAETAWRLAHQRQTLLMRMAASRASTFSVYLLSQRGRSALARSVVDAGRRRELLSAVARNAGAIARRPMAYARPLAGLLQAGAFALQGDAVSALRSLTECEREFEACGMAVHAIVCRLRRGQVMGNDEGRRGVDDAEEALRSRRIVNPQRFADMIAPGTWVQ